MAGGDRAGTNRLADLAAMIVPLGRALVAAEVPLLRDHELTMWGYVVLQALSFGPAPTQAALAESIGADKTRIINVLDDLQDRGLISRTRDPDDRRRRLVAITPDGNARRESAQSAIQANEQRILATLDTPTRDAFLAALHHLATLPRAAFLPPRSD